MKHTKANVLKVLKAKKVVVWRSYKYAKEEGEKDSAARLIAELATLDSVIELMTNKQFFEDIAKIYEVTED